MTVQNNDNTNLNHVKVAVVGAGLAGSECAWILANHYNISVVLFEMKPKQLTPAQVSPEYFCELVCSNSLKSKSQLNPAGVLKHEILKLGSLVVPTAYKHEVPAGETLAVDRRLFSQEITTSLRNHKNIQVVETEIQNIESIFEHHHFAAVVIATGPLTTDSLSKSLKEFTNSDDLYFYDAIAPIIDGDSIDTSILFKANRTTRTQAFEKRQAEEQKRAESLDSKPPLEQGAMSAVYISAEHVHKRQSNEVQEEVLNQEEEGDYLNIPLEKDEYESFVQKILAAPKVPHHNFEEPRYFNGCQPIEVLAESGIKTLSFGPMKPKGLTNPKTGRYPYAAVQLRKEKRGDEAWNMVGFQTRLTWGAQKEIFKTLPGLENAEFFRMGSMHRNTYMIAPRLLNGHLQFKCDNRFYLAGQIMGVEGYLESAATGVFVGHLIGQKIAYKKDLTLPPANTSLGALCHFVVHTEPSKYTPMNIHWGLFDALTEEDIVKFSDGESIQRKKKSGLIADKSKKRFLLSKRSECLFAEWLKKENLDRV